MSEQNKEYDRGVYGNLKAEFLEGLKSARALFFIPPVSFENDIEDQEKLRQEIIADIKEGKLTINRH